jgi:hypothetical protein
MEKFRTLEQFQEILAQNYYGNFDSSAKMLIEYGFYASDIKRMFEDYEEELSWFEPMRMFLAIEIATKIRYKK